MIVLPFDPTPRGDANQARGHAAERQLAHDLGRAFADADLDIQLYHGLRFPAPRSAWESDHTQIDHLIVHRYGMVIVESKTTGGYDRGVFYVDQHDQWERRPEGPRGPRYNMPSPVEQARRQAESLRVLLQNSPEPLLDKVAGLLQQKFTRYFPIVTLVAIANNTRLDGPGAEQHAGTVMKAEKIVGRIREEIESHARHVGLVGFVRGAFTDPHSERGLFNLSDAALGRIKDYLLKMHTPAPAATPAPSKPAMRTTNVAVPAEHASEARLRMDRRARFVGGVHDFGSSPAEAAAVETEARTAPRSPQAAGREAPAVRTEALTCRHCRSINVQPTYAKYGYCLKCDECNGFTPLSRTCTQCGNPNATIHKRGNEFYRACAAEKGGCGAEVVFWTQ
jgi:hypothetical protein